MNGWAIRLGSSAVDKVGGVAVDSAGSIIVTGSVGPSGTFGRKAATCTQNAKGDIFVLKLDQSGKLLWVKCAGGPEEEVGLDVTTLSNDDIVIGGKLQATVSFGGGIELKSKGGFDAFVARLEGRNGKVEWAASGGGADDDRAGAVTLDDHGKIIASGCTRGSATFGAQTNGSAADTTSQSFVLGVEVAPAPATRFPWFVSGGSDNDPDCASDVVFDRKGAAIWITGRYRGTASFVSPAITSLGAADGYLVGLDSKRDFTAAYSFGGGGQDDGLALAVIATDDLLVAGEYTGKASFGTLSATAKSHGPFLTRLKQGTFRWIFAPIGTGDDDAAVAVQRSARNDVLLAGHISGAASFGSGASRKTIKVAGASDIFVARLTTAGAFQGVVSGGGTDVDVAAALAPTPDGGAVVVGTFRGRATFGAKELVSAGNEDVFVWRIPPADL